MRKISFALGIAFLVLAAGLLVRGILVAMRGPALADESGLGVSHLVGALLPSMFALIFGVAFIQLSKGKPK